jgi:hypothetical protein
LLRYDVSSSVGGKLAQLGARLIEGTAKGYATSFFTRLKDELEAPAAAMTATDPAAAPDAGIATPDAAAVPAAAAPAAAGGVSPLVWGAALVVAVVGFLVWQWN